MELIFAKWMIFAAMLSPGKGNDFPIMEPERSTPHITSPVMVETVGVKGMSVNDAAPKQHFCILTPGIYTVNFRMGLLPLGVGEYTSGSVRLEFVGDPVKTATPLRVHLFDFHVEEGWATNYATTAALLIEQPACYTLRYTATSGVGIDTAKTYLSIHRG